MEKSILYQTLLPISNINDYPIFVLITKLTDLKPLSYNNGFCFRFMFVFCLFDFLMVSYSFSP